MPPGRPQPKRRRNERRSTRPIHVAQELETIPDEQLARRSQVEDWASFDELVRRYEARIYRFAFNCCGHAADARELTQETFVSVYQHLRKYDPSLSFATWLFTIARRKCIDRSRRPRRDFLSEIPDLPDTDDPSVLLGRREAAEDLRRTARQVLSDTQFQTLWLHYAEDLSVQEVARVMRRLPPHVKVLLFRARRALAKELGRTAPRERSQLQTKVAGRVRGVMPVGSPVMTNPNHL
jgi:RNA polymerase sigma-70 factor, ECF subfamily